MCDKVAVVENHTITDFGTHDEIYTQNRYYKKIWNDYTMARNIIYGAKEGAL